MERRSTFRFRLPWSQPEPEPASKSSPQPNTRSTGSSRPTRQVTRSRTTSQPSSSTRPKTRPSSSSTTENSTPTTATSEKPSSPAQPTAGTQGRNEVSASTTTPPPRSPQPQPQNSAETKTPSQSTTTSTSALPETLTTPPQSSAETKAPITNAPASPKPETQTPTSTVSQRPQSSPPGVAPSRTESQPSIPSQEEQGITSQPASPSDVVTTSNVSESSSPSSSPSAPQSREMNPKSSPTRNGPQVLSTDQLTAKDASLVSQTSSNLPSGITSQEQLKDQTISQRPTRPKQSQENSETSSKSDETLPSLSKKEPMSTTVWPQSEQVELLRKEAISDTIPEAKDRSPEKVKQPSELSEVKSTGGITEEPSKISDSSRIINEPKTSRPLETNIPEAKEVKEVVQETTDKNYSAGEKVGGFLTSKEQPDIVFQSKQANSDNDQIRVNRVSNGKQTRTSAEQDIPHEVKDNISKFIHRMAIGDNKQILEEGPVSVITLAGDNRGASMQLGSNSSKKGRAVHIHRGYKLNADESADATTDAEGRQSNDAKTMKDQELEAYMNCNVQGLNNSITFDSSIEAKSPGIHMSIPRMSSETIRSSEGTVLTEAHKAEFNVTRAQKHTYEPTIRGRCLEGLFFEPSDSDSDNPEKPQRHGCHVGSMEKKDNDIDIL